jgi:formiminoglutamase
MLDHWLQPVKTDKIEGFNELENWQLGRKIALHTEGVMPNLKKTHIAIIGIGDDVDAVRTALYRLSYAFEGIDCADLGNVRKEETSFIIPLLAELLAGGIVPIVIGHSDVFTLAQYQAYQNRRGSINIGLVDERIRFTPKVKTDNFYLNYILDDPQLFGCSVVAYQTHYADPSVIHYFENRNFELVRLGKIKSSGEEVEPVIRDTDLVCFNIAALKMSEAPAQNNPTPTGMSTEEACQLARYAGMSDKLSSFGIYGFNKKLDKNNQTAQVVALMAWYFIDGYFNRKQDFPITKAFNHLTQYIVDIKSFNYQVTFWRSNKSGRWWMEIPVKTRKKHERHRLIPCSYNDYLQACQDDLPMRLVQAFQRFK